MVRVAAVGDIHCGKTCAAELQGWLAEASERADVLLFCGDLTDYGLAEEARALARVLVASVRIPMLAVLGNHEFESGQPDEVRAVLRDAGVQVLDGEGVEIKGVGFAGVKGFGGGFGERALEPWGEPIIKAFVHEAIEEALKLEKALARLQTPQRVVLLHYTPIQATAEGEPPEIFPFLGSSRLEEPINRLNVSVVFHGHAHAGSLEGQTRTGIPVYNVALPLLRRQGVGGPPIRFHEIRVDRAQP
ncbi:MAG: metallophosphoesterase [Chloroflexi bacterium]|nr:metallophosphoesterase [Chloroflexota bacterium]